MFYNCSLETVNSIWITLFSFNNEEKGQKAIVSQWSYCMVRGKESVGIQTKIKRVSLVQEKQKKCL